MHVDQTDRDIIRILRVNGRETCLNISRKLGLNRVTVTRRMQSMLQNRVIYITAFNDPRRIPSNTGIFLAMEVAPEKLEQAVRDLVRQPTVGAVFRSQGRYNLMAAAAFGSGRDYADFMIKALPGVTGLRERAVNYILHDNTNGDDGEDAEPVSPLGKRLLENLGRDGRQSIVKLAKELGTSNQTAQRLLKRYTENGAVRVSVLVNPARVNWFSAGLLGIKVEPEQLIPVRRRIAGMLLVRAAYFTVGEFDIMARLEAATLHELRLAAERVRTGRGVRNCELFPIEDVWFGESFATGIEKPSP